MCCLCMQYASRSSPFRYSYTDIGVRCTHIIWNAGYIGLYYDGDYNTNNNASATFIKADELINQTSIPKTINFKPLKTGNMVTAYDT